MKTTEAMTVALENKLGWQFSLPQAMVRLCSEKDSQLLEATATKLERDDVL
jgi:hypothetical protein